MQHAPEQEPLDAILSRPIQEAIEKAARLAHAGRHDEAEATRFAGGYHNMATRRDPDTA